MYTLPVYPDYFPCPLVGKYTAGVDMGVLRFENNNGGTRQRRKFSIMPHQIAMAFVIKISELTVWQAWVNEFAYQWMLFPGITHQTLDPTNPRATPLIMRFISDLHYGAINSEYVEVTVVSETAPEAAEATGTQDLWIVAGRPPTPSSYWVSPGTPDNPAMP